MPTTLPTITMPANTYVVVPVIDYDTDGVTVDSTETLTLTNMTPAVANASVDPTDNRKVKITALTPGTTTVTIAAPGVPSGGVLNVPVIVSVPPNLSRIDLAPAGVQGPFAV